MTESTDSSVASEGLSLGRLEFEANMIRVNPSAGVPLDEEENVPKIENEMVPPE
ncbi:hypothetical protein HS1genome_1913 [Sulfodiicoccus acidiphilus]|uniref:Uncharacterized protein n=1 Tax=Sulfodiicoccus acidiphilus TaxID=1670455 RepID=A0A348B5S2_9CREN|nr:hypothetical protein HS1genome_1913 [Sulfodiicoccus acidiphilus]GGT92543.1 hypothetical protein GCM10007116_07870 [Sulfodiicoccus acidiphilus]